MDTSYNNDSAFDTDFNVDNDYKPTPLAITGNYFGTIKATKMDRKTASVIFTIVLDGNDEVTCSDGETLVDGLEADSRLWLPKANDKNELNTKGNMTKFQSKVNMIKAFGERTEFDVNTFEAISEAVENGEWIGTPVVAQISVDTYQGRQFNRCEQFSLNKSDD